MAEGLPAGLVTSNTQVVSEGIEGHDRVGEEDLARLWRAYATNRSLLVNDVGRRLENFFWRLWGSRRCRERLRGSQVALLFALISEGEIIRTTPIPSPRTSRLVTRTIDGQEVSTESPFSPPSSSPTAPNDTSDGDKGAVTTETPEIPGLPPTIEEERGRRRSSSRPAPILKRPGADAFVSSSSRKTATILTPTWKTGVSDPDHDEAETPPARPSLGRSSLSSVEVSESLESPTTPSEASPGIKEAKSSGSAKGKKKATFVVGTGATSKRRPAISRRKSSQSSSGNSKTSSPKIGSGSPTAPSSSRPTRLDSYSEGGSRGPDRSARPTSRSVSPISTSPFKRPPRDHLPTGEASAKASPASQDWLVDRNFRSSFVDKLRGQGFAGVKSPPATSLSTSFQASGSSSFGSQEIGKGLGIATDVQGLGELSLERLPSQVLEEDEEDENGQEEDGLLPEQDGALPRVRSQLTMLLKDRQEKEGRRGESSSNGKGKKGKRRA